ncbi:MAG: Cna B-type domain-containing protein [Propionibacteriaceae bacterium]|nr:Cna B-type domain-containing protein [Propionibacteriaceae bacterium]
MAAASEPQVLAQSDSLALAVLPATSDDGRVRFEFAAVDASCLVMPILVADGTTVSHAGVTVNSDAGPKTIEVEPTPTMIAQVPDGIDCSAVTQAELFVAQTGILFASPWEETPRTAESFAPRLADDSQVFAFEIEVISDSDAEMVMQVQPSVLAAAGDGYNQLAPVDEDTGEPRWYPVNRTSGATKAAEEPAAEDAAETAGGAAPEASDALGGGESADPQEDGQGTAAAAAAEPQIPAQSPALRSAVAPTTQFNPQTTIFTTAAGALGGYLSAGTVTSSGATWPTLNVNRTSIGQDAMSTDPEHFNAWTSLGEASVGTTVNPNGSGGTFAYTFASSEVLHIWQKTPATPAEASAAGVTGQATSATHTVASATTHAGGYLRYTMPPRDKEASELTENWMSYLFEFNCEVTTGTASSTSCDAIAAQDPKLYVQYGHAGKYYTAAHPEGLQMGLLVTFSDFDFGSFTGSSGSRWNSNHPGVNVSNLAMAGFWMDGIQSMNVSYQFFSIGADGQFDKLLNVVPTASPSPSEKTWLTIGPLVNHSSGSAAGSAAYYTLAEAVQKVTDANNWDLQTVPSIGTNIVSIPSGLSGLADYAGMYTSSTSESSVSIGMTGFERQAVSFQIVGTKNTFRFKEGNNNFGKYIATSYIRPVNPGQPSKAVTGASTPGADELNVNAAGNSASMLLNDGVQVYSDTAARQGAAPSRVSAETTTAVASYPNGVQIRMRQTYTANGNYGYTHHIYYEVLVSGQWVQFFHASATKTNSNQTNGTNAVQYVTEPSADPDLQVFVNRLATYQVAQTTSGWYTVVAFNSYRYTDPGPYAVSADGASTQYANGTATPDTVSKADGQITVNGSAPDSAYSAYITTDAYYSAQATGTGANDTFSVNRQAKVFYFDITQPVYHLPNDSVVKPDALVIQDVLPLGLRLNTGSINSALGEAATTFPCATAASQTAWTLWQGGVQMSASCSAAAVTTQTASGLGTQGYRQVVTVTLSAAQINALVFDGTSYTVRIPVVVDTYSPVLERMTRTSPFPAWELFNHATSSWQLVDSETPANSFSWQGSTNETKNQISFIGDFTEIEFTNILGEVTWDDPTSSSGAQLEAADINELRQKAFENQPAYVDFLLYSKIGNGAFTDTGNFYRLGKPATSATPWGHVSAVNLPKQDADGNLITYKLVLQAPAHWQEVSSLRQEEVFDPPSDGWNKRFGFTLRPVVSVGGHKTWIDADPENPTHPATLTVYLTLNGVRQTSISLVTSASNNWNYSFTALSRYGHIDAATGELTQDATQPWVELEYGVTEQNLPFFTKLDDVRATPYDTGDVTHNLTNTYKTIVEFTPIRGQKNWADEDDFEGKRPDVLGLRLYRTKAGQSPQLVATYYTDAEGGDGAGGVPAWGFDFGLSSSVTTTVNGEQARTNTIEAAILEEDDAANLFQDSMFDVTDNYLGYPSGARRLFAKNYRISALTGEMENYTYSVSEFAFDGNGQEVATIPGYELGQTTLTPEPYLDAEGNYHPQEAGVAEYSYFFAVTNRIVTVNVTTQKQTLSLRVVLDQDRATPVEGVGFEVYQYSVLTHSWVYIDQAYTDADGYLAFSGLGAGANDPAATDTGTTDPATGRIARDNGVKYRLRQSFTPTRLQESRYEIEFELVKNMAVAGASVTGNPCAANPCPAIPAAKYTVLKNGSMKLFEAGAVDEPIGTVMGHANRLRTIQGNAIDVLGNTAATNTADADGITAAVTLERDGNTGNSHNLGSTFLTGANFALLDPYPATGSNVNRLATLSNLVEYSYYNTDIVTTAQTQTISASDGTSNNDRADATRQEAAQGVATADGYNHIDRVIKLTIALSRKGVPVPATGGQGAELLLLGGFAGLGLAGARVWRGNKKVASRRFA